MPSKSPAQRRLMAAVAHNPKFAKKVGIPQSVGREFHAADQGRGYAGGGKVKSVRELAEALSNWKANKLPQEGFFSTLDELIETSPGEVAPAQEWANWLKPGRKLVRDGVEFPLKKEELDYAKIDQMVKDRGPATRLSRKQVQEWARQQRPDINQQVHSNNQVFEDAPGSADEVRRRGLRALRGLNEPYVEMAMYDSPGLYHKPSVPGSYEENTTVSPDIEAFNSHFNPQDISWSRTTQHKVPQVPTDLNSPSQGKLRLIEEIQSDRHSKAADKIFDPDPQNQAEWADIQRRMREAPGDYSRYALLSDWRGIPPDARDPLIIELRENLKKAQRRMGYRTPDDDAEIDRIDKRLKEIGVRRGQANRIHTDPEAFTETDEGLLDEALTLSRHRVPLAVKPPDAPFKEPRDYSTLEIRKQLLNAVRDNDRYLGVTRGRDQIDRYEQGMDPQRSAGMRQMYDELYPSVLQKEAGRYGAKPIGDVEINAVGQRGKRPEEFTSDDWEHVEGFGDYMDRFDGGDFDGVDHAGALESTERLLTEFRDALEHEPYLMRSQANAELEKLEHKYTLANRQFQAADPEMLDEMPALWGQNGLMRGMHQWYERHWQGIHDPQGVPETKSFPAAELTPEVMDKIRKIGVPIFNLAGAAGVGSQLLDTDDPTDSEPSPGMAEGGAVAQTTNPRKTLDYWKQVADSLPSGLPEGDSVSPHLRRVLGSLASQVLTRDRSTGEMSLGAHPGVIDEVKALPTMGPMVYKALRHMSPAASMPAMSDEQLDAQVPEWARAAERDTQDNAQAARVGMGVPEAHGFVQNLEEAGGQMLGQLPLPGAALQKLKKAKGLMGGAQRVGGSAMEYLGPTIEPTVANYLKGTAFGGTMGAAGDKMGQMMDERQQKEWIAQAMQEVLDEEQHKAANPPDPEADHDAEDDEALAELGYADGGKVSAVKAVAAQLKTALQGVEDPAQRKAMIDRALAALKGVSIPTERRSALNTAALGLSDAAADTVPIRRQQRFGDYQSNILHLLENSDEQVQPISNIDPASVVAHVPQSYPVRRPPAQPEPGRGSVSQEDWQRMLDAGMPPDARVTYKADGGEVKQSLMYRPVAQAQKTPAQLAQAAAANASANPALSANVRGAELTADQYAHYGEGPEHNFFPDRTSGLPALPPGFAPVQNPVAQGGNGQQQGGGGSGSVLSGLGALGSLYKEATGRSPIKDLYQGGKNLYNEYFATPQAEIDAEAAAKDTSQTNSQIDQELQQMPNPANNPTYLGSAAAGAAGAGLGALGASLAAPAGTVAITEGSQAIAALAAQAGGGAGAAGAAAASAGGAGGTGALGGGASADAAGAGSGALGVAGKAIPIAAAAYAAYGAYQAAAVGDKKGAVMNGAAAGAAIGSVVPVIGTAVGAVVGAVVGLVGASFGDQNKPSEAYYGSYKKQDPNATIRGWTQDQANGALFEAIKSHTKSGKAEAFEGSGELYKAFGISTNNYKGMQDQMADFIGGVIHTAQQSGGLPTDPAALAKMDGQQIFKQLVVPALSAKIGEATGQAQNAWSEGGDRSNIGTLENMFADYTDFMISGDNHAPVTIQSSGAAPKGGAKVQKKARGGLCSIYE